MLYVNPLTGPASGVSGGLPQDEARRKVALKELEQFFVYTLLQEMRKSVPDSELLPKNQTEQYADQMMDDMLSQRIAETGRFGIANMVEQQLRLDETRDPKVLQAPQNGNPPATPPPGPLLGRHGR